MLTGRSYTTSLGRPCLRESEASAGEFPLVFDGLGVFRGHFYRVIDFPNPRQNCHRTTTDAVVPRFEIKTNTGKPGGVHIRITATRLSAASAGYARDQPLRAAANSASQGSASISGVTVSLASRRSIGSTSRTPSSPNSSRTCSPPPQNVSP